MMKCFSILCVLPLCSACQTLAPPAGEPRPAPKVAAPRGPVVEMKPAPKPGQQRIQVELYELTRVDEPALVEIVGGALSHRFEEAGVFDAKSRKPIPADTMQLLHQVRGTDRVTLPPGPLGERFQVKIGSQFVYPLNPEAPVAEQKMETRQTGVFLEGMVTRAVGGKLRVELTTRLVGFAGFVGDGGKQLPTFTTREIERGPVTIEHGGGVPLGRVGERVQSVEDKVPVLGDLPLTGRLFRSASEQRIQRYMVIGVSVVDG